MKLASRLIASMAILSVFLPSAVKLEAYGYQPDCGGYAYTDSGYSVNSTPLIPLAVVAAAVIVGVCIYSSNHNHHHHHHGH